MRMQAPAASAPRAAADDRADEGGGLQEHGYAATVSELRAWSAKLVTLACCSSSQGCCIHLSEGIAAEHTSRVGAL